MEIKVVRQKRKTVALKMLDSQNAVLKVPCRYSAQDIKKFLESRRKWLQNVANKLAIEENMSKTFDLKNAAWLFGEKLDKNTDLFCKGKKGENLKKYYHSKFFELEKIARELSEKTGLAFAEIKKTNSKCIWGSFSSEKVMKLNWRLVILPLHLVKYVVLHELCHGIEMNHGAKFWSCVQKVCPNFKECKKQLSQFSFVLKEQFE